MNMFVLAYKKLANRQGSLTADERELLRPRSLQRDGKTYVNYTADFLWLGHCKGKLATSLRLRGAALKAFVEVGTSSAVRAVLQRASRADTSGLREELGGRNNGMSHLNGTLEDLKLVLVKRMDGNGRRGVLAVRKSHIKQQKTLHRMQTAFEGRVALLEKTLDAAMCRQEERMLSKLSKQCEQMSMRALLYGQRIFRSLFGDLKGSFRQSFSEVVDEARASGVIELTRHAGTSAAHQADQALLLERGRKLPSGAEGIALFQEVGDLLPVSTYLEGRLEPEQQSVISHFTPPFSKELKKRKLLEALRMQEKPWIAWCQGAWRIQYTERDREMMDALYDEPFWKQKMEKMLLLHAGGHGPQRQPHASADRGGAHAARREPAARHVTPEIWRSLFHKSSSR